MTKRVLYIEDNPQNLRLVRKFLTMGGYTTLEAETGEDGLRVAFDQAPDAILVDINLPDIDGTEVTRRLRADARTSRIPVVALTANAMSGDRERFLAAGCDAYLAKPLAKASLFDTLEQLLSTTTPMNPPADAPASHPASVEPVPQPAQHAPTSAQA